MILEGFGYGMVLFWERELLREIEFVVRGGLGIIGFGGGFYFVCV